ncbi:hypothetical protein T10_1057 [Trichinella papuae]|uniref:Uncharacterized protein n=1 Tax=Trichinella papuae TaxID=268474 RepID=A0A0V1MNZ5_9BILA|nr:hypothetical protein T10_1057 [Trichinella papuae]
MKNAFATALGNCSVLVLRFNKCVANGRQKMRQTTSIGWKIFTTLRLLPINVPPVSTRYVSIFSVSSSPRETTRIVILRHYPDLMKHLFLMGLYADLEPVELQQDSKQSTCKFSLDCKAWFRDKPPNCADQPHQTPLCLHPLDKQRGAVGATFSLDRWTGDLFQCDSPPSTLTFQIPAEACAPKSERVVLIEGSTVNHIDRTKGSTKISPAFRSMEIPRVTSCFQKDRQNSGLENILRRLECRRNCALLRFSFSWFLGNS